MKTIKFRAWDKSDEMMYVGIQNGIDFEDGSHYSFSNFLNRSNDDYHVWEIMQFTGLYDKNGVEVYVGDICLTHLDGSYPPYQREVVEAKDRPVIEFKPSTGSILCEGNMKDTEVIGNIYENPELINNPA